jgi:hypothetical protein
MVSLAFLQPTFPLVHLFLLFLKLMYLEQYLQNLEIFLDKYYKWHSFDCSTEYYRNQLNNRLFYEFMYIHHSNKYLSSNKVLEEHA